MSSDVLMDDRLPDTGFHQFGGTVRVELDARLRHAASSPATCARPRTAAKRYDQLLGGDGNLISDLNDLSLDLF